MDGACSMREPASSPSCSHWVSKQPQAHRLSPGLSLGLFLQMKLPGHPPLTAGASIQRPPPAMNNWWPCPRSRAYRDSPLIDFGFGRPSLPYSGLTSPAFGVGEFKYSSKSHKWGNTNYFQQAWALTHVEWGCCGVHPSPPPGITRLASGTGAN